MKRRRIGAELYSHYIRKLQLKHTKRIQKKHKSNWYSAISFGLENVTRSFAHHVSRVFFLFVDKAHRISHAVAENGIAIATIGRRKTDCEDVAMA